MIQDAFEIAHRLLHHDGRDEGEAVVDLALGLLGPQPDMQAQRVPRVPQPGTAPTLAEELMAVGAPIGRKQIKIEDAAETQADTAAKKGDRQAGMKADAADAAYTSALASTTASADTADTDSPTRTIEQALRRSIRPKKKPQLRCCIFWSIPMHPSSFP